MTRISNPNENDRLPAKQTSNGKTILLAEDDPFISRMYQTKLTNAGYEITLVHDGHEAYEYIKAHKPDLAMLDINMPELTGFQVIEALRADGVAETGSQIMVLTNSSDPKNQAKALALNVDYIIKAEITPQEVLTLINQKLGVV